jgi:hypothetical protein
MYFDEDPEESFEYMLEHMRQMEAEYNEMHPVEDADDIVTLYDEEESEPEFSDDEFLRLLEESRPRIERQSSVDSSVSVDEAGES